jgi:hypothetical protein
MILIAPIKRSSFASPSSQTGQSPDDGSAQGSHHEHNHLNDAKPYYDSSSVNSLAVAQPRVNRASYTEAQRSPSSRFKTERSEKSIKEDIRSRLHRLKLNDEQIDHVLTHMGDFQDLMRHPDRTKSETPSTHWERASGTHSDSCLYGNVPRKSRPCFRSPSLPIRFDLHSRSNCCREIGFSRPYSRYPQEGGRD